MGQGEGQDGGGPAFSTSVGTAARLDLEQYLERRIYLDLHVRVEPDWRENRALLAAMDRDVDLGMK